MTAAFARVGANWRVAYMVRARAVLKMLNRFKRRSFAACSPKGCCVRNWSLGYRPTTTAL